MSSPIRTLIMGAAGRDFHNFNTVFRDDPRYEVLAFTATQIPNIAGRKYPAELAGPRYPHGISIHDEAELDTLIAALGIQQVIFSYSDVSHEYVMHIASRVLAAGADFRLLGTAATSLKSTKPVVAVCAIRTGAGKSQTTRAVATALKALGYKIAVVRHPMPYGDLVKQAVQRFANYDDLEKHDCTIEEREEYEPHIAMGSLVFAGVDYERILRAAEAEADIVLWDGGNNDLPFYAPDLHITIVDPHRPGHEQRYYPGESNLRAADVVVINKIDSAAPEAVAAVEASVRALAPKATVIYAASPFEVEDAAALAGKRVLAVEDGPTLTHGEMAYGAAALAARRFGATLVDPRPYAVGSITATYAKYPTTGAVLPAMGYGAEQMRELEQTINQTACDVVLVGTPIDLSRLLDINHPTQRVRYALQEIGEPTLAQVLQARFGPKQA